MGENENDTNKDFFSVEVAIFISVIVPSGFCYAFVMIVEMKRPIRSLILAKRV